MRIIVEADSIASHRMSGVGHVVLGVLKDMDRRAEKEQLDISAVVPYGKAELVKKYGLKHVRVRQLPPGYKYVNYLLTRTSVPVPMDLLYGRGIYIFPNYKTWNVPFSTALTFVHDVAYKIFPETTHPKNLRYLAANFGRWLARTDKVICISHTSAGEVAQYFPHIKNKIVTIYLGADTKVYKPAGPETVVRTTEKYGLHDDYFLYVGNIEPRKNLVKLLEAYKCYADMVKDPAQLVIVGGDGWRNENIKELLTTLVVQGYDIFRPSQYVNDEDLPALLTGARALIHVSLHEGFGLTPVEALACGTKVIVSDIPVFKEVLGDIRSVLMVDPHNSAAIANVMAKCDKVDISKKSQVQNLPTWSDTVEGLLGLAHGGDVK